MLFPTSSIVAFLCSTLVGVAVSTAPVLPDCRGCSYTAPDINEGVPQIVIMTWTPDVAAGSLNGECDPAAPCGATKTPCETSGMLTVENVSGGGLYYSTDGDSVSHFDNGAKQKLLMQDLDCETGRLIRFYTAPPPAPMQASFWQFCSFCFNG